VSTSIVYALGQLVAADFNGDGKLDLAGVVYLGSDAMVFLGNGDGTFTQGVTLPGENESIAMSIVAADFNGDHVPDIAFLIPEGPVGLPSAIEVFLGQGRWHFPRVR
jgi:FG-GAP-like repeat